MKKITEFQFFLAFPLIIRSRLSVLFKGNYFKRLEKEKPEQKILFDQLKGQYESVFNLVSKYSIKKYMTPTWNDFNLKIAAIFLPLPPFDFLSKPLLMYSMVMAKGGNLMAQELRHIEKTFPRKIIKRVLKEDPVGCPIVINREYLTSSNRIHQLYHLARYESDTGSHIAENRVIAEWGGGYGNMVVIVKRLIFKPVTYICIDTPLFVAIQWLYLSTIFGPDEVNLIFRPGQKIKPQKINLLPVSLLTKIFFKCDLFISNWALSESSVISQKLVDRRKWFGAKHLLLGFQGKCDAFKKSERVGQMVQRSGGFTEEINLLPSNYYGFK